MAIRVAAILPERREVVMLHEQTSPRSDYLSGAAIAAETVASTHVSPGAETMPGRRVITLDEAIQICDEIRRNDERRRQEILDREARIAMELDLPG